MSSVAGSAISIENGLTYELLAALMNYLQLRTELCVSASFWFPTAVVTNIEVFISEFTLYCCFFADEDEPPIVSYFYSSEVLAWETLLCRDLH